MLRGILLIVLLVVLIKSYGTIKQKVMENVKNDTLATVISVVVILVLLSLTNYILEKVLKLN